MSTVKSANLTSSFPIWVPCISFFCLVTLARTFNNIYNNGDREHPCVFSDLKN